MLLVILLCSRSVRDDIEEEDDQVLKGCGLGVN